MTLSEPLRTARTVFRSRLSPRGVRAAFAWCAMFALGPAFIACSSSAPKNETLPREDWRLVPEATILGDRRQFFLYGRHLDSAKISAPASVETETGALSNGSRVLSLYLKVLPLGQDSLAAGEKPGSREIRVGTRDTSVTFIIKVVDEAPKR